MSNRVDAVGWIVAGEGAEMIEILAVDPRHGVITDDLTWSRGRRRPMTKAAASEAMSARARAGAPDMRKPGLTTGPRDTPTAFEGGDDG